MVRVLVAGLVALSFSVPPRATTPAVAGFTAHSQVAQAAATAKKWRPDAVLTHVSSLTVNPDGTAKWWLYTFYAPQTKKTLNITIMPGAPLDTLEVRNTSMQPIGDIWVDSDKAMQTAKQHDFSGTSLSMGLVVMGMTGSPVWAINNTTSEENVSVMLDGKTGAFIRRDVVKFK
jgi:hypothetical protein